MAKNFSKTQALTARKEYRCDFCMGSIEKGERYWRASGMHEGRWATDARHPDCAPDAIRHNRRHCEGASDA